MTGAAHTRNKTKFEKTWVKLSLVAKTVVECSSFDSIMRRLDVLRVTTLFRAIKSILD